MGQNACRALNDLIIRLIRVFGQYLHVLLAQPPPGCARIGTGSSSTGSWLLARGFWLVGRPLRRFGATSR